MKSKLNLNMITQSDSQPVNPFHIHSTCERTPYHALNSHKIIYCLPGTESVSELESAVDLHVHHPTGAAAGGKEQQNNKTT